MLQITSDRESYIGFQVAPDRMIFTLDEISGWIDFSATEKRKVIAALDARRSNFGAAILSRLEDRVER